MFLRLSFLFLILSLFQSNFEINALEKTLLTILQESEAPTNDLLEKELWEVHSEWINRLLDFINIEKEKESVTYPKSRYHPIFYFNQAEAKSFLRPILEKISHFPITDELINRLFFEVCPVYKESELKSSITPFQEEKVKLELLKAARRIYELAKGEIVLCLGQTPAYLGEMVKTLEERFHEGTAVLNVPFSGRPGYLCKLKYRELWPLSFLDLITPDGTDIFRSQLKNLGICPEDLSGKRLFIVDQSTGASVASFLAFLKSWFDEESISLPKVVYLEMGSEKEFTVLTDTGHWVPADKPNFRFSPSLAFDLPTIFLGMPLKVSNLFDKIKDNLRIVPSYNARHFRKGYLEDLIQFYPTEEAKILIEEYRLYVLNKL